MHDRMNRSSPIVARNTALAVPLLLFAVARADIVNLAPAVDTTILRDNETPLSKLSNGAGDGLYVGHTYLFTDKTQRGLLRFDLSSIPPGATITSASLTLQMTNVPPTPFATPVALHRVTASWGEGASLSFGGGGTQSETGDANWYDRFFPGSGGNTWATPGGDFAATASATASATIVPATPIVWSSGGLAADVAAWIATPSSNQGWILVGDETRRGSSRKFASRENAEVSSRPRLTIEFSTGCTPAQIASHPQARDACLQGSAEFSVGASGTGPITYRWQYEDPDVPDGWTDLSDGVLVRHGVNVATVSGSGAASLLLTNLRHEINGNASYLVRARVSNACAEPVASNPANLKICAADFNCDSQIDFFDYLDFVAAFDGEEPASDFNGDETIDFFDYLDFAAAMDQGCEE